MLVFCPEHATFKKKQPAAQLKSNMFFPEGVQQITKFTHLDISGGFLRCSYCCHYALYVALTLSIFFFLKK